MNQEEPGHKLTHCTYSDPSVLEHLERSVSLIHLHLQHGSDQLLQQEENTGEVASGPSELRASL